MIFKNSRIELYNTDLYDHGLYSYLMSKSNTHNEYITQATAAFIQPIGRNENSLWLNTVLASHYDVNDEGIYKYDTKDVSEQQLLGLLLAITEDDRPILREKFDYLIHSIIYNNYALINEDKTKSKNANFGKFFISPYSALTLLAALKLGAKFGILEAKKHYDKLKSKYELIGQFDKKNTIARYILGKKVYQNEKFKNKLEENVFNMLYLSSKEIK